MAKKSKGIFWLKSFIVVILFLIVAIVTAWMLINSAMDMFGIAQDDTQLEINIANGSSFSDISKTLKKNGIIEYRVAFMAFSTLRKGGDSFKAGNYIMTPNMTYDQIIDALKTGDTIKDEVRITFYEGMSIREIAKLLQENKVCTSDEFIECLNTTDFGYEFEQMIPKSELRYHKLEGYLFPDTYDFYVGENPKSVVKKFLSTFDKKIFQKYYNDIQKTGMTLDQVVTLASIIQEEASLEDEMYNVSSIFHNRIDNPGVFPKLESDVTIFYVEKDIKPYQKRINQPMYDAYNTYVCVGLPVGAICSPGESAIKSAFNPADTEYYFFVTDVKGKYYYSKDAKTHYANVRVAEKVK